MGPVTPRLARKASARICANAGRMKLTTRKRVMADRASFARSLARLDAVP